MALSHLSIDGEENDVGRVGVELGDTICQSAGDEHRRRELTRDRPIPARHVYTVKRQPLACIKPVRGRLPNHERPELVTSELWAFGVSRLGEPDQTAGSADLMRRRGPTGALTADNDLLPVVRVEPNVR